MDSSTLIRRLLALSCVVLVGGLATTSSTDAGVILGAHGTGRSPGGVAQPVSAAFDTDKDADTAGAVYGAATRSKRQRGYAPSDSYALDDLAGDGMSALGSYADAAIVAGGGSGGGSRSRGSGSSGVASGGSSSAGQGQSRSSGGSGSGSGGGRSRSSGSAGNGLGNWGLAPVASSPSGSSDPLSGLTGTGTGSGGISLSDATTPNVSIPSLNGFVSSGAAPGDLGSPIAPPIPVVSIPVPDLTLPPPSNLPPPVGDTLEDGPAPIANPEPSTLVLVGLGAAGLGYGRWRRRRRRAA